MKKFLSLAIFFVFGFCMASSMVASTSTNTPTSTITGTFTFSPTVSPTMTITTTSTPTPTFTPCPDFTYLPTPTDDRTVNRVLWTTKFVKQLMAALNPVKTATWVPTPRTNTIPSNIAFNNAALPQIEVLMVNLTPTPYPTPPAGSSRDTYAIYFRLEQIQLETACP